jgi:hypothetical protein
LRRGACPNWAKELRAAEEESAYGVVVMGHLGLFKVRATPIRLVANRSSRHGVTAR